MVRMIRPRSRLSLVPVLPVVLAVFAGCASAPAAPTPAAAPAVKAEPAPPRVSLICHDGTTAARFEEMGVPSGELPRGVVLSGETTYVLFSPGRLMRLTRKDGKFQAQMALSKPGETWAAMDVDPVDGSLWLVSERDLALRNIAPDWKTKTVKLQKVEGDGGFSRVLAAPDALYVTPTIAEKGVWRISRDGKVLGTEFPTAARKADSAEPDLSEPMSTEELLFLPIRLERDEAGRIVAWDPKRQTVHRVDPEGHWAPAEEALLTKISFSLPGVSVVKGIDVGGQDEQWYLPSLPRGLFHWKGHPVLLGAVTSNKLGKSDTLLLVPKADGVHEMVETCYGASIVGVAATPERYVAYTWNAIIFGDFAGAPDLP
jgi:hypothetical protein